MKSSLSVKTEEFGEVELTLELSGVDSFILDGYSVDLDRELSDDELTKLDGELVGEIQYKAYESGRWYK
jgi:hypothetical protein